MKSNHTRKPLRQSSQEHAERPFFSQLQEGAQKKKDAFFQTKLAIGEKNDKHEKQADAVADQVQRKAEEEKEKPAVQKKQEEQQDPGIQKMGQPEEDKPVQKATAPDKKEEDSTPVNKKEEKKKEPGIQKKTANEEENPVQKMSDPEQEDKNAVQKKEAAGGKEKDEPVQRATSTGSPAPIAHKISLEERIRQNKGKGQPLPDEVRRKLEHELNADFSQVVIHTDNESVAMNQELQSLAFTNGFDIFFNAAQYQPFTLSGQKLLAHELTHVIQQTGVAGKKAYK